MYSLSFSNTSYIVLTVIFAVVFLLAYRFRHSNASYTQFLGLTGLKNTLDEVDNKKHGSIENKSKGGVKSYNYQGYSVLLGGGVCGFIECTLLATFAACYGLSFVVLAIIVYSLFVLLYRKRLSYLSCSNHTQVSVFANLIAILNYIWFICLATVMLVKILIPLIGWDFVHSIIGLILFIVIFVITGGNRGLAYVRNLLFILCFGLLLYAVVYSLSSFNGFNQILHNLRAVAISNGYNQDYYIAIANRNRLLEWTVALLIGICGAFSLSHCIINSSKKNDAYAKASVKLDKHDLPKHDNHSIMQARPSLHIIQYFLNLIILLVILSAGVLANATLEGGNLNQGSQIVTYQTVSNAGEIGYTVRLLDANSKHPSVVNIIPYSISYAKKVDLVHKPNYLLSLSAFLRYYLPAQFSYLVALTMMLLFIYSVSSYLLLASANIISIMLHTRFAKAYDNEGLTWLAKINVVVVAFIAITGAKFLMYYFNLEWVLYTSAMMLILLFIGWCWSNHNDSYQKK